MFFVELNFRSKKWLLRCSYNHYKDNIAFHLSNISAALYKLCTDYKNITLLADFNAEVKGKNMLGFMSTYNLKNLVKQKHVLQSLKTPSRGDLILKNSPRVFQNRSVFEKRLPDFHRLTTTVLKQYFSKSKPKIVNYGDNRNMLKDISFYVNKFYTV